MVCSRSSNRKRRRHGVCSSGSRRSICRGGRIRSRCRSVSSRCTWPRCPASVAEFAALDVMPSPPAFVQPEAATAAELVPALAESVAKAKRALGCIRRCEDGGDVAAGEAMAGTYGDATRRVRSRDHAEPLVSPPRPAARLSAAAQSAGAVGLRSDRRRESVRG